MHNFLYVFNYKEIDISNNKPVIGILTLAPPPKGKWVWLGEMFELVLSVERMTFYMCSMITK